MRLPLTSAPEMMPSPPWLKSPFMWMPLPWLPHE
jgi:hypothetical protein